MNKDKDVAVFYNTKVYERLEIENAEVLLTRDLDKVKSLARVDWEIAWMICSDFELKEFSNFYNLINNLELTSRYIHFYHEVPLKLYHWFKENSFRDLVFESRAFMALQLLLYDEKEAIYQRQLINSIYLEVLELKKYISKIFLKGNEHNKFKDLIDLYQLNELEKSQQLNIFKYWSLIEDRLERLPAEPFRKGYEIDKLETWGLNKDNNIDFQTRAFVVKSKHQGHFNNSRSTRRHDNYEYFDTYLKTWKDLYLGNYYVDNSQFEFKIETYSKPDYKKELLCKKCYVDLEFERKERVLDIPEDNDYLCSKCFIKKYIDL